MSDEILRHHKAVWEKKPILRIIYTDWYRELASWLKPGRTLEVGGGTGNLKEFSPDVLCTDVTRSPWLDAVADAQYLPFATKSLTNIVLFDALHHVENVRLFFEEAVRTLRPRGRLIIMDPYISWLSWPVYHFLHPEPVDLRIDPLELQSTTSDRRPFDANQAVSTILFERRYEHFQRSFPQFELRHRRRMAFFVYPLSGGFEHPSLLPVKCVRPILAIERALDLVGRFLAFRMLVVLEKAQ
jgi:SAM-dependent methyltransferase